MTTKELTITFIKDNKTICTKNVPYQTQVSSLLDNFKIDTNTILAVKINNEICPLDFELTYTARIEPLLNNSKEGASVYRRSLCLLLACATHELYPDSRLLVGHSLDYGYYYNFENLENSEAVLSTIKQKMLELVLKDLPINTEEIAYEEAITLFEKLGLVETRKQLNFIGTPTIKINSLDGFSDMYFGQEMPKSPTSKTHKYFSTIETSFIAYLASSLGIIVSKLRKNCMIIQ